MKVIVIYRPISEHGRLTDEFIHDFQRLHPDQHLETIDVDSREGMSMATLYDVVQYPAILVVHNDGTVQNAWQGDLLPRMDEVASYARN